MLDMPALHALPELDALLTRLLGSEDIIKTGAGVSEDIARLACSYPAMQVSDQSCV